MLPLSKTSSNNYKIIEIRMITEHIGIKLSQVYEAETGNK